MDKTLYCKMNLFTLNIPVYIVEDDNFELIGETNRDNIVEYLMNKCEADSEIDHIIIFGPEGEGVKAQMLEKCQTNYKFNNVRIEVNPNV